jgi:hypothetical protein
MLLRRSDQWSFIQAQIPAVAFVFGYEPGSREEAIYRHAPSRPVWRPGASVPPQK